MVHDDNINSQTFITFSVIIMSTQLVPVKGRVHFSKILCLSPYKFKDQMIKRLTNLKYESFYKEWWDKKKQG